MPATPKLEARPTLRTVSDAHGVKHYVRSVVDSARIALECGLYLYNGLGVIDDVAGTVTCLTCIAEVGRAPFLAFDEPGLGIVNMKSLDKVRLFNEE